MQFGIWHDVFPYEWAVEMFCLFVFQNLPQGIQ